MLHSLGEVLHDDARQSRMLFHQTHQRIALNHPHGRRFKRDDSNEIGLADQYAHLVKHFARAYDPHDLLASGRRGLDRLKPAALHEVQSGARFAFQKDDLVSGELYPDGGASEGLERRCV